MGKGTKEALLAKILAAVVAQILSVVASIRCIAIYHQPKQPDEVRKFRKW